MKPAISSLVAAVVASLLAACGGAAPRRAQMQPAAQPPAPAVRDTSRQPVGDPPEPTEGAFEMPVGSALGMPKGLNPGAPAAYWIWYDLQGGWHLRTTTAGASHQFGGRILAVGGDVVGAKPMRTEHRDKLRYTRRGLVFDFQTQGSIDGIEFRASDNGCVRFNLRLDRGPQPKRIFIGSSSSEPPKAHFLACPSN